MHEDRWRRIDALFDEALELSDSGRRALLAQKCSGDPDLLRAVERLLALEAEATSFLAPPVRERPTTLPRDEAERDSSTVDELAGLRIGPYRLVRPLGRGGMGIVYLAYREEHYRQEVAIKLVRRSLLSAKARRRLATERQVLARLEHPNIARLYDGGTTDDGIPYLVMERVVGLPIDRYCDERRSSLRERLELVLQILSAVAVAHHHLRVHCDIKPSNILVARGGTPKLLDFGIAKLLSPDEQSEVQLTVTGTGQRPLTPAYASPEQVLGGTITTATDIYSVGVLLYELLSGHLPHATGNGSEPAFGQAVAEAEPLPPSRRLAGRNEPSGNGQGEKVSTEELAWRRRLTPRELEQELRGDLDAILSKAIRKEPRGRYASAESFADDIERYLEARPVAARQGNFRYRASRMARRLFFAPDRQRRHERWAWAAVLFLVAALSPLALWLGGPPPPCQDSESRFGAAWRESDRQRIENAFLATDLPFAADSSERVLAALDSYALDWIGTDAEICRANLIRGEGSARLLDLGRLCLAGRRKELRSLVNLFLEADKSLIINGVAAVNQLGSLEACTNQIELGLRRSPPADPTVRRRLDRASTVAEAQLLRQQLNLPVDQEALEQSESEARGLDDPQLLARILFASGLALTFEEGDPDRGIARLEEALESAIAAGDRPLQTRLYAAMAKATSRQRGDLEMAKLWERLALASLEALSPGFHGVEYAVYDALGALRWESGDWKATRSYYEQALRSAEKGDDPMLQIAALKSLGMLDDESGQRAIELLERELGPQHVSLVSVLMNQAASCAWRGAYDEAYSLVQRSHDLHLATWGPDNYQLGFPLTLIGQIRIAQDRPEDAVEPLTRAITVMGPGLDRRSTNLRDAHVALAEALLLVDRLPEAEHHLAIAAAGLAPDMAPGHPSRLYFLRVRGDLERRTGALRAALASHEELLSFMKADGKSSTVADAVPLASIAQTYLAAGRPAAARPLFEEAWALVGDWDRHLGAEIALGLASTVAATDPQRTREWVDKARARLSPELPLHAKLLESIDQ